jgi:hypothetical protein
VDRTVYSGSTDKKLKTRVGISRTGLLVWAQLIKKGRENVEIKEGDGNLMRMRTRKGAGLTREYLSVCSKESSSPYLCWGLWTSSYATKIDLAKIPGEVSYIFVAKW